MTKLDTAGSYAGRFTLLTSSHVQTALADIRHGVERETLRVQPNGALAVSSHPRSLGSALTHNWITTDFSESLLEFITPPEKQVRKTIAQLADIHKFVSQNIGNELLWPLSMPCFIDQNTKIPIAHYGSSNIAQMKRVYRKGLHNRYGSMMQVIAGVHLNFSFSDEFWQQWSEKQGLAYSSEHVSAEYFHMLRNFRRRAWLIPYLFGASPALCESFIAHRHTTHDFKKTGKGTLYLPFATSLRMSDLGYTSAAQSELRICYNSLDNYVTTLRDAIGKHAPEYSAIPAGRDNEWQQLNSNILQIENELYAPIRPKQIAHSLEKPTDALASRGVKYLEVRGLDVNPFSPVGIDAEQIRFIDVLLTHCLVDASEPYTDEQHQMSNLNMNRVVLEGRRPGLMLQSMQGEQPLEEMAARLFEQFAEVADVLDHASGTEDYSKAVKSQLAKIQDPSLTTSGQVMKLLLDNDIDNSALGIELAKEYQHVITTMDYLHFSENSFVQETNRSIDEQSEIEGRDQKPFAQFIQDYSAKSA